MLTHLRIMFPILWKPFNWFALQLITINLKLVSPLFISTVYKMFPGYDAKEDIGFNKNRFLRDKGGDYKNKHLLWE